MCSDGNIPRLSQFLERIFFHFNRAVLTPKKTEISFCVVGVD